MSTLDPATGFLLFLVLATLSSAGCSAPIVHYDQPGDFARNLFHIAREGNPYQWGTQLTAARRDMGTEYVETHFSSWRSLLVDLQQSAFGGDLSVAEFRIVDGALEFHYEKEWHHLIRVTMEDGGWKINQD